MFTSVTDSTASPSARLKSIAGATGTFEGEPFSAPGPIILKVDGAIGGGTVQIEELRDGAWVTYDAHKTTLSDAWEVNLTTGQVSRISGVGVAGPVNIYVSAARSGV